MLSITISEARRIFKGQPYEDLDEGLKQKIINSIKEDLNGFKMKFPNTDIERFAKHTYESNFRFFDWEHYNDIKFLNEQNSKKEQKEAELKRIYDKYKI